MRKTICVWLLLMFCLAGCATKSQMPTYRQIDPDAAKEMMAKDDGHVIVDVRRQDEYDAGHIPGAILIPNESIDTEHPAELPDPNQIILVYCRSGNRSRQAAEKLANMGYTNVYEFGGLIDWTGDIVTEENGMESSAEIAAAKSGTAGIIILDSFDGGGPEYTVTIKDPGILSCSMTFDYGELPEEPIDGATYQVVCTFTGLKTGRTDVTISAFSPIEDPYEMVYDAVVDENMNVTLTNIQIPVLRLEANGNTFRARLADNSSADDLLEKLSEGPITIDMHDYSNFEKVGDLPWSIKRNDEQITTEPGDIILYLGTRIVIYYDQNSWNFTRLGKIEGVSTEDLLTALGEDDVTVTFSVEWTK